MDFERGPIDPIDVEAWTRAGDRSTLASDAAQLAAQLDIAVSVISGEQGTMAAGATPGMGAGAEADLFAAADAHDRQARDFDSTIGAVAGNADAMEGEIAGLSGEAASDITSAASVDFGSFTPHPADGSEGQGPPRRDPNDQSPRPPEDENRDAFADNVQAFYLDLLGRSAGADEIDAHRGNPGGLEGVRQTILNSDEYRALHAED